MKALNYLLIVIFLNTYCIIQVFAQTNSEEVIVKEGNLRYIKSKEIGKYTNLKKVQKELLTPESYTKAYLRTPNWDSSEIEKSFFREIFPKERVEKLPKGKLVCHIQYNGIKKEIAYVEFVWVGKDEFPFTLKEIDLLESKLKSYPFIYINDNEVKMNHFSTLSYPILFDRLYQD